LTAKPDRIYVLRTASEWITDGPGGVSCSGLRRFLTVSSFRLDPSGLRYLLEQKDFERYESRAQAGLVTEASGYRPMLIVPSSSYMKGEYEAEDVL